MNAVYVEVCDGNMNYVVATDIVFPCYNRRCRAYHYIVRFAKEDIIDFESDRSQYG